jgi:tRNA(adenine34) deaminase
LEIILVDKLQHEKWMREALKEAELALKEDEVPIGAVVVKNGSIIGRGHNRKEALKDPTAHAEIIAITAAANSLGDWRLEGAILYSTIEPCLMCAGAILQSRLDCVVYGAKDEKFGAFGGLIDVRNKDWNWNFEVVSNVLNNESKALLKNFFNKRRDG